MNTIDSKKPSKLGFWAMFLCLALVLGFIADSVGVWKLFQREPAIEADVLEDGLREYLDKKDEENN